MLKVMKKCYLPLCAVILSVFTACSSHNGDVISTLFIHKYGAALTESDWSQRGGHGQVVTVYKDGTTVSENYVDHLLEGKTTFSFPHSNVVAKEEQYSRGNLISETLHFTSGVPKQKTEYLSDNHVHITTWFQNGNPKSHEKIIDGRMEEAEYYSSSNEIEAKVRAGVGTKIDRNTYGEFLSKIEFQDGEKRLKTTYHLNGDPLQITPYFSNQIHGLKKHYHINGIPERFEEWSHGVQQGTTTIYRDGQPHSEVQYVAGLKNGIETIYNDHGNIVQELTWKNDLLHGVKKSYINDTVRLEWYYRGKRVSHSEFEQLAVYP